MVFDISEESFQTDTLDFAFDALDTTSDRTPSSKHFELFEDHHALVRKGVEIIVAEEKSVGGQLGRPSGALFRFYERLKRYAENNKGTLFVTPAHTKCIEEIYRYPLRQSAIDTLNRQLRTGITDEDLASLDISLREEDRFCIIHDEEHTEKPHILCSLGLSS